MKKVYLVILVLLVALGGYFVWYIYQDSNTVPKPFQPDEGTVVDETIKEPCCFTSFSTITGATFLVPGSDIPVVLKEGVLSYDDGVERGDVVPLPEYTKYFVQDGNEYVLVPIVASTGGSGNFAYLTLFYKQFGVYKQADTFLLGDRIKVSDVAMYDSGEIKVTILNRKDNEPFSAEPTVTETISLNLNNGQLNKSY